MHLPLSESIFEQIQDGAELDDVLAQIASVYQSHYIDHDIDVSAVTDFDKIKEKLYVS